MASYDITALDTPLEFDTTQSYPAAGVSLSTTQFALAWRNSDTVKYTQVFDLDRSTGEITALSSPLNFYSSSINSNFYPTLLAYDSTHYVILWRGTTELYMRSFQVDGGGAVTAWGSQLTVHGSGGTPTMCWMDSTHILAVYAGSGNDGYARIFELNTSTGELTGLSSEYEFDLDAALFNAVAKLSATKAIIAFGSDASNNGYTLVLDVNTSTWAVTAAGSQFEFDASSNMGGNCLLAFSDTKVTNAYINRSGSTGQYIQSFNVNNSTWAVTNNGSSTNITTYAVQNENNKNAAIIDDTHFIIFYTVTTTLLGNARTYEIDQSNGALTQIDDINFDSSAATCNSVTDMGDGLFVNAWTGVDNDGFVQAFQVELPPTTTIKTWDGIARANIKTLNGVASANIKTINGIT